MFCLLFNSLQLTFDLVDFESQKNAWLHSWVLTCFSSDCGPYHDSLTIGASGRAHDWAAHDSHTLKIEIKQHNWNDARDFVSQTPWFFFGKGSV